MIHLMVKNVWGIFKIGSLYCYFSPISDIFASLSTQVRQLNIANKGTYFAGGGSELLVGGVKGKEIVSFFYG